MFECFPIFSPKSKHVVIILPSYTYIIVCHSIYNSIKLFTIYVFIADWLAPDATSETSATCKYCRVVLKAHKKDLVSHAKTEKHKKATA